MAEKRLIDANALRAVIKKEECDCEVFPWAVDNAPTVDAVEVIRCGACKHGSPHEDGTIRCSFHSERNESDEYGNTFSVWMEPEDFCSYGERRTDE